jgi:F420-non-reducing hydrogenase iron-sulfur subunit
MENAAKDGFSYSPETVVMPVKCTGLIKVSYLLKLFARGFEGVFVLGCPEGDCHYFNGSKRCEEIVEETREILETAGIPGQRLGFDLISQSRGAEFKKALKRYMRQFTKGVKRRKRVTSAGHK